MCVLFDCFSVLIMPTAAEVVQLRSRVVPAPKQRESERESGCLQMISF